MKNSRRCGRSIPWSRLIPHAFPPITNGQQLSLRFGTQDKEIHFFVKCPDCTRTIELRLAADGDYGIIVEMLHTALGRWADPGGPGTQGLKG